MRFNGVLDSIKVYEAGKPIELVVRDYGVAEGDIVKLASNENPYGVSPKVAKAMAENSHKAFLYPDDSFYELKEALAAHYGVEAQNLIIGAGSDQVLDFAVKAVLDESATVLMNKITFAMYEIYARQTGATIVKTDSVHHDLAQFEALYLEHNPELIFLCTPNNPTGDAISKEALFNFLDKVSQETLVVVDGAYMEFAKAKDEAYFIAVKELLDRYANVLYTGTFSKAYGMGGMRVGYGIGRGDLVQALHKLRPPFNITTLSLLGAIEALKDPEFVTFGIEKNFEEMERYTAFAAKNSLETIPSYTNFIALMLGKHNSKAVAQALLEQGIIVRDISGYGVNAIRITIGTPEQNTRCLDALQALLDS